VSRPAWAARHRYLARAANVVDPNSVRRKSHVATFAGHNNKPEVRQIGLLGWKYPSTEGESLVSFEIVRSCEKSLACFAVAMRFLVCAAFGDPMMKFVAIKKIV
jgi:hypothetical protein